MSDPRYDLTTGNLKKTVLRFAFPYLLACFLQTFYGLADLFIVGLYNESTTTAAVAIGSQVMHMITVMLVGLAMGTTVHLGHAVGAKDYAKAKSVAGNSIILFSAIAAGVTFILLFFTHSVTNIMLTPEGAVDETNKYLFVCFAGVPFILAYNVVCSVYRGAGNSKSPMIFAAIACVVNIIVDFVFIGAFKLGATGAAFGTVIGQAVSVLISILFLKKIGLGFKLERRDLIPQATEIREILNVGFPICMQDGLIQIAFIVITVIANSRGLIDSVSVGIVEKIICFMFLVPSAFLSTISAVTAQNMGANKPERARECLKFGLAVTVGWGLLCWIYSLILPETLIGLFRDESEIIAAATPYLQSYASDCFIAAIHFCFSGFFCGVQKSGVSFLHNIISVVFVRVPGSYFASVAFASSLLPMGLAAPLGSLVSVIICVAFYRYYRKQGAF